MVQLVPFLTMKNRRLFELSRIARRDTRFSTETQMLAAAVTATEMQFRPFPHRLVEYTYALLLLLLARNVGSISIGVSQISVRHFTAIEGISQLQSLFWATSARNSLATCCKLIEAMGAEDIDDVRKAYNGNSTVHYRKALQKNYGLLQKLDGYNKS